MYKAAKRVCVIGAGPSGMSAVYQFKQLEMKGQEIPAIVCFDKQSDWGGLWKYSWQTGTDEYGEPVHGSMYQGLWTNGPKEAYELPDYTWKEHFGKPVPSYPPREIIYDYLQSRWSKSDLRPWIRFSHVVRQVTYNDSTNDFTVVVKDLSEDKVLPAERFDYVIVASGHFSVPKMPFFPGIDQFPGRVIHSHSFRNASHFKGKRVLIIGSSYSAEDIALQCLKYGAENIICCWRTRPMGFKWPPRITEKPMLTLIEESTVHFKDGSTAEVDDIILCTGYHYSLPFMEESLRLKTDNNLYPEGLYKSILWTRGGNNKVLYIGMQDQSYTFPMFDVQAKWVVNYIMGELKLPGKEEMETDSRSWITRMGELNDVDDRIDFQTAYVAGLVKESNYGYDLDISEMLHAWNKTKLDNITTYRDQSFTSKHTGHKAPLSHTPFMEEFDDSMEHFLKTEQRNL